MPAPIVYGIVSYIIDGTEKKDSHVPMCFILYSIIITSIIAFTLIYRKYKK